MKIKILNNTFSVIICLLIAFSIVSCSTANKNTQSDTVTEISSVTINIDSSKMQTDNTESSDSGNSNLYSFELSNIPEYTDEAYIILNNNIPIFTESELNPVGYEEYGELDSLGRCTVVTAVCGKEIMPKDGEERESISSIKPTGWVQAQYDIISGKYLYNRCHLIGWQLSAENANKKNLITGTKYLNINGMLPFENMVADYIKETDNHVAYRITPVFNGNDLLAYGVIMEAYSIEDDGEGICFNVFCYNVQPGIKINYSDGSSNLINNLQHESTSSVVSVDSANSTINNEKNVYRTPNGKRYHLDAECGGKNSYIVTFSTAVNSGLTPCQNCVD